MTRIGDGGRRRLAAGGVLGAGAWLLGYALVYLVTADRLRESGLRRIVELFGGDLPTWKMVGWVFFNTHAVDVVVEGPFGGAAHFVGGDGGFTPLLYAVPPLLLLVAGGVAARAGTDATPWAAALTGAATVVGYGGLSVAAVVLFATNDPAVAPDAVTGVLLAGLVYPVAFGAAGAVAVALAAREAGPAPTTRRL